MLDEVHPNLFFRNLFTGLSRFIPTLFFGQITAMHRGHFSTMDSNADRIVYKVASTNILCRAITDSFSLAFFDALTRADSFKDCIAHLLKNLFTLLGIFK